MLSPSPPSAKTRCFSRRPATTLWRSADRVDVSMRWTCPMRVPGTEQHYVRTVRRNRHLLLLLFMSPLYLRRRLRNRIWFIHTYIYIYASTFRTCRAGGRLIYCFVVSVIFSGDARRDPRAAVTAGCDRAFYFLGYRSESGRNRRRVVYARRDRRGTPEGIVFRESVRRTVLKSINFARRFRATMRRRLLRYPRVYTFF